MPGRHPDDDVLADLAADVLPPVDARAVEAHVMGCARCAALLEDAERVRALLLADDPGPVPPQVWQRIEAALGAEIASGALRADRADHAGPAVRPAAPIDAVADTAAFQAFVAGPDSAVRPSVAPLPPAPAEPAVGTAGWSEDADPLDDPARWTAPRALRGGGSSRRDSRTDGDRRRAPVLLAAAAAVVLVGVVGSVVRLTTGTDSSASFGPAPTGDGSTSSSAPEAAAAGGTVVLRSGKAYTEKTLAQQAGSLLSTTSKFSQGRGAGGSSKSQPPGPVATLSDATADLTNPANLSACLTALNVSQDKLLAVDLATYEGREAAVLLLRSPDGGNEVWVVERTCSPGNEGALKYARLSG